MTRQGLLLSISAYDTLLCSIGLHHVHLSDGKTEAQMGSMIQGSNSHL